MTHGSAERQNLSLQSLTDVWAGGVSALIFYAEYLGLGAALGESFFGRTPTAAANGTLLVLLMVVIGTVMAMCSRVVFLSGPRGASVAILGGLTLWLCRLFETSPAQRTAVVALLMAGAGLTVLCARHPRAQVILRTAPVWLIQGFLYATATSIVANAVASKLYGCLQVSEMMTWSIFLLTVILGVVWKPALVRAAFGRSFRAHRLLRLLHPLGLLVATGLSWWAYEATVLARAHDKRCRRLGDDSLDLGLLAEWLRHVGQVLAGGLPAGAALAALAAGCLLGLVLLIENVTTFEIDRRTLTVADRTRLLEVSAAMNLTAAVVGGSCISYSTSRTMVLRHLGGLGKLALLAHGGVVAAVALLAGQWVAQVPGLTVAVTLTLVGAQMISGDAKMLWRKAYHPRASTPRLMAGAMFWVVLSLSLAVNSSLAGFLAGAFVMLVHATVTRRRAVSGRSS